MKAPTIPLLSICQLAVALLSAVMLVGLPASTFAQTVESELTAGTIQVGQAVELRIITKGKSQGQLLDQVEVDGLQVAGSQQQFQMQMALPKFGIEVATVQTVILVPTRTGEFTIPSLRVRLDGKVYKTTESVLRVTPATGGRMPVLPAIPVPQTGTMTPPVTTQPPQPSQPTPPPAENPEKSYFGEMVIPKETAFVGEVVPVDLRFNIDANFPSQFGDRPNFSGEGFTILRTSRPSEVARDVNGFDYACIVFRTAITAAKAGTLEIPPASVSARVQVPVQAPRSDDLFGGLLRNFGMTDLREIEIPTESATLDVKPLPREGRPDDFDGAVGEFKIEASATPAKAGPGEPITLRVVVSGRGNFEAMGPPAIANAEGWKVYDPSENFEPSPTDPVGFNGTKTYEFTLVARDDQTATPPVQFSFFDPAKEEYVTIEGPPVRVQAAGAGTSQPDASATQPQQTASAPTPAPQGNDLSRDYAATNFQPLGWASFFVIAGTTLTVVWTLGLAVLLARRYAGSPAAERGRKRKEQRKSIKTLDDDSLSDLDFLNGCHLILNQHEQISPELSSEVDHIRSLHEKANFSTQTLQGLGPEVRRQIIQTLEKAHDQQRRNL